MWSAKISFDSGNLFSEYAKKRKIKILVFPLSWNYEKSGTIVTVCGIVFGEEKAKNGFFRDWKNDKKKRKSFRGFKIADGILRELEVNGDFFVGKTWESPFGSDWFNRHLVYTRPWLIDEKGLQTIVLSSFEKKYLDKFISGVEKFCKVKVHYLRKENISNVAFRLIAPDLTEKQKWAIDLAISRGYYEIPRKISIQELAKISGIGFATFHGHLRKAERKIIPFWFSG